MPSFTETLLQKFKKYDTTLQKLCLLRNKHSTKETSEQLKKYIIENDTLAALNMYIQISENTEFIDNETETFILNNLQTYFKFNNSKKIQKILQVVKNHKNREFFLKARSLFINFILQTSKMIISQNNFLPSRHINVLLNLQYNYDPLDNYESRKIVLCCCEEVINNFLYKEDVLPIKGNNNTSLYLDSQIKNKQNYLLDPSYLVYLDAYIQELCNIRRVLNNYNLSTSKLISLLNSRYSEQEIKYFKVCLSKNYFINFLTDENQKNDFVFLINKILKRNEFMECKLKDTIIECCYGNYRLIFKEI
ncbi:hypothetical protein CWI39_1173p0020 [Hamiltosporidium magnivora]|uniref:Uncharacterized protein n=1 Tax=Hamiltosporidium magnivora TaxID=148818 RepID=A0A4Q9L4D7_9MICR|nr:hypothetical protein CWI39_1173p0020 [Hamiltosporidium magnivora]